MKLALMKAPRIVTESHLAYHWVHCLVDLKVLNLALNSAQQILKVKSSARKLQTWHRLQDKGLCCSILPVDCIHQAVQQYSSLSKRLPHY